MKKPLNCILIFILCILLFIQNARASYLVIVPTIDGVLSAFEANTGENVWNFDTGGPLMYSTASTTSSPSSSSSPTDVSVDVSTLNYYYSNLQTSSAKKMLEGAPYLSPEGILFLGMQSNKKFEIEPFTGGSIENATIEELDSIYGNISCRSVLQVVRTEKTLEAINGSETSSFTAAQVRVFAKPCMKREFGVILEEEPKDEYVSNFVEEVPQVEITLSGQILMRNRVGVAWVSQLSAAATDVAYLFSNLTNTLKPITLTHEQHNLQLSVLSGKRYKGTPYELGFIKGQKTLLLPAPDNMELNNFIWNVFPAVAICVFSLLCVLFLYRRKIYSYVFGKTAYYLRKQQLQLDHAQLQQDHVNLKHQFDELRVEQEKTKTEFEREKILLQQNEEDNKVSRYNTEFEELEELGEGGFGTVFKARNRLDKCDYAIKKVCLSDRNEKERERVLREVRCLALLDHPHIVRYYHSWMERGSWERRTMLSSYSFDVTEESKRIEECVSKMIEDEIKEDDNNNNNNNGLIVSDWRALESLGAGESQWESSFEVTFQKDVGYEKEKSMDGASEIEEDDEEDNTLERSYGSTSSELTISKNSTSSVEGKRTILYIQMQFCHQGTLTNWLNSVKRTVVSPKEVIEIFLQVVKGVAHIHANGLIHRDLKPANILLSSDGCIKIADFGLSTESHNKNGSVNLLKALTHSHTTGVGSPLYCSPEQLKAQRYDAKVDIFSLGIIFYEMFHIFSTQMERTRYLADIREKKVSKEMNDRYPSLVPFVLRLVSKHPSDRPSARDILNDEVLSLSNFQI